MDEQLVERVRAALRDETRDVDPSSELDARVSAIVSERDRGRRRGWPIAMMAATIATVVGVAAIVVVAGTDEGNGHVVTAGPGRTREARWRESSPSPLGARRDVSLVWTGREAIVWGGIADPPGGGDGGELGTAEGAAFDPATNRWRRLAPAPLIGRFGHVAVWTGTEMIVWGGVVNPSGRGANGASPNDGASYDPVADRWRRIAPSPLPAESATSLGSGHQAVWTGTEMLVWGRTTGTGRPGSGAAYDPSADLWRPLPPLPGTLTATRSLEWTGEVVLAFPRSTAVPPRPGATVPRGVVVTYEADAFDPEDGSWRALPPSQLSPGIGTSKATWTGDELLVVGAATPRLALPPGLRATARYRPSYGAWYPMASPPFPGPFSVVVQEWTGDELLVVAVQHVVGQARDELLAAQYSPVADRWRTVPVPRLGDGVRAVQADGEVLVWSGERMLGYG